MEKLIIYEFCYCSGHDSGLITLSLHKTREGAEGALESHKENLRKEHQELADDYKKQTGNDWPSTFGKHAMWKILETEVLE